VRIGDDELDASHATLDQAAQELAPARLRLVGADVDFVERLAQPRDLTLRDLGQALRDLGQAERLA